MSLTISPLVELGLPLPSFELPTVFGDSFSSKGLPPEKPLVICFMCSHCPYVKAIEDRLIQLGHDLKSLGIPMLGICSNDSKDHPEDAPEALAKRALEKKYSFTYLHDQDQSFAKKIGAVCTPDYFVYDKSHLLAYRGRLDDNWKNPQEVNIRELYEAVLELNRGQKISRKQTPSMGCNIKWKLS